MRVISSRKVRTARQKISEPFLILNSIYCCSMIFLLHERARNLFRTPGCCNTHCRKCTKIDQSIRNGGHDAAHQIFASTVGYLRKFLLPRMCRSPPGSEYPVERCPFFLHPPQHSPNCENQLQRVDIPLRSMQINSCRYVSVLFDVAPVAVVALTVDPVL